MYYRKLSRYLGLPLLGLLGLWMITRCVVFNVSGSMPVGLYWKIAADEIIAGDRVLACLPADLAKAAYDHGILNKSSLCAHGYEPLLKQVIATANDHVVVDHQRIIVNGQAHPAPVSLDERIPRYLGTSNFNRIGVWLYGSGNPKNSWDARYFGALNINNIHSAVRALWVSTTTKEEYA